MVVTASPNDRSRPAICWFRRDLRLADNPALTAAARHRHVVCAVIEPPAYGPGTAALAWRAESLRALDRSLRERGSALLSLDSAAPTALLDLVNRTGATRVYFNRAWDPASIAEESLAADALAGAGVHVEVCESAYLVAPRSLLTGDGREYRVFTPFHRAWERRVRERLEPPMPAPARLEPPPGLLGGVEAGRFAGADDDRLAHWTPGERGAETRLAEFVAEGLAEYASDRDRPDVDGTSQLSASLAAGELSARQVAHAAYTSQADAESVSAFVRQLAWREFSAHVLDANPHMAHRPLRPEFERFPWSEDAEGLRAWTEGCTGFGLVDAGMRQLRATGWMHNRARLVAGSFLVKQLLVPWQLGERHFAEQLVDFDPASNAFNWQWVAGSGADAAPYFRIFNPETQAKRFDPQGTYRATFHENSACEPIVDLTGARQRALAAYQSIRSSR